MVAIDKIRTMNKEKIDKMTEAEIKQVFRHIPQKVEEFKRLLGIAYGDAYSYKQLLYYAISLFQLIQQSKAELETQDPPDDLTKILRRLNSPCTLQLAQLMYLAHDIITEFELRVAIKVL